MKSLNKNNILIICDTGVDPEGLPHLFSGSDFPVSVTDLSVTPDDLNNYGAIAHVGHSKKLSNKKLAERVEKIADEEWMLMTGDNSEDLYCAVELTKHASETLRILVRTIWARFNTP